MFLICDLRSVQRDAKREDLMRAMRTERPETCFWLNFAIIAEHFAGKVGGSDVASLKKILGIIIMKKLE